MGGAGCSGRLALHSCGLMGVSAPAVCRMAEISHAHMPTGIFSSYCGLFKALQAILEFPLGIAL